MPNDLRSLLDLYDLDVERADALLALCKQDRLRGWWDAYADSLPPEYTSYISLETEARATRNYEPQIIPGLFQTEEYARGVIKAVGMNMPPGEIERRVEARLNRQRRLTDHVDFQVWVILDESVLRRVVGGAEVMREQLVHLVEAAELPNVVL